MGFLVCVAGMGFWKFQSVSSVYCDTRVEFEVLEWGYMDRVSIGFLLRSLSADTSSRCQSRRHGILESVVFELDMRLCDG